MHKLLSVAVLVSLAVLGASAGYCVEVPGGEQAWIAVDIGSAPISTVNVASPTLSLELNYAAPGQQPRPTTAQAAYNITNNETGKKLVGQLDSDTSQNSLTVRACAAAPPGSGGTSCGWVELTAQPADMVTGIGPVAAQNVPLYFQLSGTVDAGTAALTTTFTLTLTSNQ
jgi:hypothetical protein